MGVAVLEALPRRHDVAQCEPVEIDPRDTVLLRRIGRLRVRAWATFRSGSRAPGGCWLDEFDLSARHWAFFDGDEPVAAARLSVHGQLSDLPDAPIFDGVFQIPPAAPIAAFNRLVVHPAYRGLALSLRLDCARVAAAIEAGCRSVVLETHSGAARVAQLTALGFRVVGPSRPYPPGNPYGGDGVVVFRDLSLESSGRIRETVNRMGWSSDTLNELSEEFVRFAAGCSAPVLDIGAAYGVASLAALETGAAVVANDLSAHHLDELRARTPMKLRRRLKTVQGCFPDALMFADESFDAIHCSQVLHFLGANDIVAGLHCVFRWLRPGGKLFVLAATPYQATHRSFVPVFLDRKARGDLWPGLIDDLRRHNHHWSAGLNPPWLHVFDDEVLSSGVRRAGFVVESARMFSRTGLPDFCRLDGRENLAVIASKPRV